MIKEPTPEQCSEHASMEWEDERGNKHAGVACWYPQMGGYVGKCIVEDEGNGGCFDAYVWHDGSFPFLGEGDEGSDPRDPIRLHHCVAEQFITFGQFVRYYFAAMKTEEA